MPNPAGGAPSDVGPDGGLMDPGMVGPDGSPMDDGGAPPPFGGEDDGGGDEGAPDAPPGGPGAGGSPPPGDSKKDDSGSKSDKGGKGSKSKKESARRYAGFDGQLLNEDQYIRHLAVTLSGAHPVVMAALRADAGRRRPFARKAHGDVADEGLRDHMHDVHDFQDESMRPGTLRARHDFDHYWWDHHGGENKWERTGDGSRSPGFIARRTA